MTYVIAGNKDQFRAWAAEHGSHDRSDVYVSSADRLRGVRLKPGDRWVITGTPWDHPEYEQIMRNKLRSDRASNRKWYP